MISPKRIVTGVTGDGKQEPPRIARGWESSRGRGEARC
jgi:hypothetical protein